VEGERGEKERERERKGGREGRRLMREREKDRERERERERKRENECLGMLGEEGDRRKEKTWDAERVGERIVWSH
jgi:U4/U6.U5 tri-snRNP-associated protein 1